MSLFTRLMLPIIIAIAFLQQMSYSAESGKLNNVMNLKSSDGVYDITFESPSTLQGQFVPKMLQEVARVQKIMSTIVGPYDRIIRTFKCYGDNKNLCPYIFDKCTSTYSPANCAGGVLNTKTNLCEMPFKCNNGGYFNTALQRCEAAPTCPTSSTFNSSMEQCKSDDDGKYYPILSKQGSCNSWDANGTCIGYATIYYCDPGAWPTGSSSTSQCRVSPSGTGTLSCPAGGVLQGYTCARSTQYAASTTCAPNTVANGGHCEYGTACRDGYEFNATTMSCDKKNIVYTLPTLQNKDANACEVINGFDSQGFYYQACKNPDVNVTFYFNCKSGWTGVQIDKNATCQQIKNVTVPTQCDSGFQPDVNSTGLGKCYQLPIQSCPNGGTLSNGICTVDQSYGAIGTVTYSPGCDGKSCSCPMGGTDPYTGYCSTSYSCGADSYSRDIKKCVSTNSLSNFSCDVSSYATQASPYWKCIMAPQCSIGTYNKEYSTCYLGDLTCPLGNYTCNKVSSNPDRNESYCSALRCLDGTCKPAECNTADEAATGSRNFSTSSSECGAQACDATYPFVAKCGVYTCPKGFSVQKDTTGSGYCYQEGCPSGTTTDSLGRCTKKVCPTGTLEDSQGRCVLQ